MPKAVQIGAGSIGRGFIGQLFYEGGYETTFVDADEGLVENLKRAGRYPLHLVGVNCDDRLTIGNLTAISAFDAAKVTSAIDRAGIIATAAGVRALPAVAGSLAAGINERARNSRGPIDILLCENQWHAAATVREMISPHIADRARTYFENGVGLVETVIGRMVPAAKPGSSPSDPLLVVAEPYKELPIDRRALRGPAPRLPGLIEADNFPAYEARKLLLHNMSHAALAYLGYQRGHEYIWQCAADAQVFEECSSCIDEASSALIREYHFDRAALHEFSADLMARFTNKVLGDTVARVAADPIRKLRGTDRLIGAAALCAKHGIAPRAISRVIDAALRYDNPDDPSAVELQRLRNSLGDTAALTQISGINPAEFLGKDDKALPR
ncbi:MAG: hypothetical protein P4L33_12490 [Capsulimonadaceae bacterium]|nr:hypothetical protein [Capsulimonadaceae bacterium]